MNKKQREDKRFELYLDIIKYCKDTLGLWIWGISFNWHEELEARASIDEIDYTHFTATIDFRNDIVFDKELEQTFEEIFWLLLHEVCHIFTGSWNTYFRKEKYNLELNMWQSQHALIQNHIMFCEEQMTWILHTNLLLFFKQTKEYKELNKRFKDIN